jgi:hypothetical protein
MVRTVTFPLSALNNIPGVSGIEDVVLEVIEADDVTDPIIDEIPSLPDIEAEVRSALDDALADGVLADVDETLDIDIPGADVVADAVLDALDVEPGLFGPLEDPLDVVLQEAVRDGLEALGELDVDLGELGGEDLLDLPDVVDDLIDDVQELKDDVDGFVDDLEDVADDPEGFVRGVLEAVLAETVAAVLRVETGPDPDVEAVVERAVVDQGLDPEEPILSQLIDQQIDRLTDGLVSEEARQELEDALGEN